MTKSEKKLADKINLEYAADNLPRFIEKIIVGMPVRISGDEKQLLEIACEIVCAERDRRNNAGRPRDKTPSPDALKMRAYRKRKNKLKNTAK